MVTTQVTTQVMNHCCSDERCGPGDSCIDFFQLSPCNVYHYVLYTKPISLIRIERGLFGVCLKEGVLFKELVCLFMNSIMMM